MRRPPAPALAAGGIVLASLFLRLIGLTRVPPGLFADEAYTGYDAWSLLRTGRDLWGERLPIYFSSWGGDAVEGLYRYLTVPFVAALGPEPLAVRFPAALAGALTVLLTWLLGRRLLGDRGALVAAALLAISPWHLPFSRIAFRGILLPLMATAAVWLATRAGGEGGEPRPRSWVGVAGAAGLCLYTYSVAKLFVPLLVLLLLVLFRRELRVRLRPALAAGLLLGALAVPAMWETFTGEGQIRFRRISAVSPEALDRAGEALRRRHPGLPGVEWIAGSRVLTGAWTVTANYASHFSPEFLLFLGDRNLRHSPPGVGQLLWIEGLLLLAGIVVALHRRQRADLLLLGWLLLGPVADSLTSDRVPNALRALAMLPAPQLLAASGALALLAVARRAPAEWARRLPVILALLLAVATLVQSGRYLHRYFTIYPSTSAPYWNAAYPEGVRRLALAAPPGARLAVARPEDSRVSRYALNPYLHSIILFYTAHPPADFQAGGGMGRFEVSRIPERGLLRRSDVPAGTWLLLPADRVEQGAAEAWIEGPDGRHALAILVGSGGG